MTEQRDKGIEARLSGQLRGHRIVVPETRQLDILAALLERRGADVLRLPLVSIRDVDDPKPVNVWLQSFIDRPPDYFVILTGEGLRRLRGFAERAGREEAFVQALRKVFTVCRGPKPGRALWEIGLKPGLTAVEPTTDGVIASMRAFDLRQRRAAVQLYGQEPNRPLMDFLESEAAEVMGVAPYRYASASDETRIVQFIRELPDAPYTAITFTSQPQFRRLQSVARQHRLEDPLVSGLNRICVAAVGPVVAACLREAGVRVTTMPEGSWFMKPMVSALVDYVNSLPAEKTLE